MYSFIPLACLLILNILIIVTMRAASSAKSKMINLKRIVKDNTFAKKKTTKQHQPVSSTETQITIMLLSVTMTFLILTSPMASLLVVERIWDHSTTDYDAATWRLLRSVTANLMFTNHAVNLILYTMSASRFREQLINLLTTCRRNNKGPNSEVGNAKQKDEQHSHSTTELSSTNNRV